MRAYENKEELKNEINKSFTKYISEFNDIPESLKDKRVMVTFIAQRLRLGQKTIVDISHPHIVERASIQIIDDGYQHD